MLNMKYKIFDVSSVNLEDEVESPELRAVLFAFQRVWETKGEKGFKSALEELVKLAQEIKDEELQRELVGRILVYFRDYSGNKGVFEEALEIEKKMFPDKKGGFIVQKAQTFFGIAFREEKAQSHKEGLEEGLEKGREEERKETALKMLQKKMELQVISEITGLSKQKLQQLAKK